MSQEVILKTDGLSTWFPIKRGILKRTVGHVRAIQDVSIRVHQGETLGLVGESGCGKTTLVQTILRLTEPTAGSIHLRDGSDLRDITGLTHHELKKYRKDIQIVFQDPSASMNPAMTVGEIVAEPLNIHRDESKEKRRARVQELLEAVGLKASHASRFPGSFSGGQKQRIGIARALALNPEILILDEPVSALDVSVQSQILNLLKEIKKRRRLSYLFIAHNLDVVRYMSDRIAVMYLGRIVEEAATESLYRSPLHPYTEALIAAIPIPHPKYRQLRPNALAGEAPDPANPPSGCAFRLRCPFAEAKCEAEVPPLREVEPGHKAACHLAEKLELKGRKIL